MPSSSSKVVVKAEDADSHAFVQVRLINTSPFVLTLVGEVLAGPLNDYICLILTERNSGIYEPEFQLALILAVLLLRITDSSDSVLRCITRPTGSGQCSPLGLPTRRWHFPLLVYGHVIDAHETMREEGKSILTHKLAVLVLTVHNSICNHQCSKSSHFWHDTFCQLSPTSPLSPLPPFPPLPFLARRPWHCFCCYSFCSFCCCCCCSCFCYL